MGSEKQLVTKAKKSMKPIPKKHASTSQKLEELTRLYSSDLAPFGTIGRTQ